MKAGALDLREEFSAKSWSTEYNLKSVSDGRLKTETLPDETATGAQGFFLNMRRPTFADPRVREALGLAFDFEWSNKNMFYGLYTRTASIFENSDLKAEGSPTPEELALLEPLRGQIPDEAFGPVVSPPVSDGSGLDRKLLQKASRLLDQAGWKLNGPLRRNDKGEPLGSSSCSTIRLSSASSAPMSRACAASVSTPRSASSMMRNISSVSRTSISTP